MELTPPSTPSWCIISVYRPDLLEEARARLRDHDNVEVVLDRRVGERRRPERIAAEAATTRDRRDSRLQEDLRVQGFAIVPRRV